MRKKLLFLLLLLGVFLPYGIHKTKKIYQKITVSKRGFWVDPFTKQYFDEPLAEALLSFLKKEKAAGLVDFGCGAYGYYVRYFLDRGFYCVGFDGNPYSPKLSHGLVQVKDLSEPFDLGIVYDYVLSLEVGEHIPPQFEKIYLENLCRHAGKGIIISWAVKGQKGRGHVNCKNNDEVKKIFDGYGFIPDEESEKALREKAHIGWFKHTLMVFRKVDS